METNVPNNSAEPASRSAGGTNARRRHRNGSDPNLRYFLPKSGSSPAKPELGQEMASEGEALIEALKSGQTFFTVDGLEICAGSKWRRQSCDCETGCRSETGSKLVRKDQHKEFSDDQALMLVL